MTDAAQTSRFDELALPHLGAAYNLARWLTRNDHDAEDLVQEAYLRAFKSFGGFRGGDVRAWLLTIVRNTCYTRFKRDRAEDSTEVFDEGRHGVDDRAGDPEALALEAATRDQVRAALDELPAEFREVIVLREMEGLSYKEIAAVIGIPVGTVMSRLARARAGLERRLSAGQKKEARLELPRGE